MNKYYHQLHLFTKLKVLGAQRMASLGAKDEARETAHFVRNSCIIEILKPHSGILFDVPLLEFQLRELESSCHPLSPALPDADKFSQILTRLDLIAGLLSIHWGNTRRNVSQGGGCSTLKTGKWGGFSFNPNSPKPLPVFPSGWRGLLSSGLASGPCDSCIAGLNQQQRKSV